MGTRKSKKEAQADEALLPLTDEDLTNGMERLRQTISPAAKSLLGVAEPVILQAYPRLLTQADSNATIRADLEQLRPLVQQFSAALARLRDDSINELEITHFEDVQQSGSELTVEYMNRLPARQFLADVQEQTDALNNLVNHTLTRLPEVDYGGRRAESSKFIFALVLGAALTSQGLRISSTADGPFTQLLDDIFATFSPQTTPASGHKALALKVVKKLGTIPAFGRRK